MRRWIALFVIVGLLFPSGGLAMGVAHKQYNWIWNHYAAPMLGQRGQPPPAMVFGSGWPQRGRSYVTPGAVGARTVVLSNDDRKLLRGVSGHPNRYRSFGQRAVAHELRHVFQPDNLVASDNAPQLPVNQGGLPAAEQDANLFAAAVMRRIKRDHRRHMKGLPPLRQNLGTIPYP